MTSTTVVTIGDALAALRAAFPEKPLDPAAAFTEWGTSYTSAEAFMARVRGRTWTELPAAFLEWHHDAPMFLGPTSIVDYLPAYVAAVLRGEPALSALPSFLFGVLTRDDPERFDARFANLSPGQRSAIKAALEALAARWQGSHRHEDVQRALDSYWRDSNGQGAAL